MVTRPFRRFEALGASFGIIWENVAQGDDGEPIDIPGAADRSIQVFGNFDGGTVVVEGSLEETPSNYFPLTDLQGNAISLTAAGGELISEITNHTRWCLTGAGASAALTVIIMFRSA